MINMACGQRKSNAKTAFGDFLINCTVCLNYISVGIPYNLGN